MVKKNLVQALQYLEDLEVSYGSENDSDLEKEHQDVTKILIQPPIDSNENNSDVDSGDEEDPSIDNLSGNQFLAPVSLMVNDVKKGEIHVEQKKNQQEKDPGGCNCSDTGSKKRKALKKVRNGKKPVKKKAKEAKEIHGNLWQHKDIPNANDLSRWTFPKPVRDLHYSPVTLFELFITDKFIEHICKGTNRRCSKGKPYI